MICTESVLQTVLTVTYRRLKKIFGSQLEDILLYGSYARGDYDSESDIDVMVLVNMTKEELCTYRREISDLSSEMDLEYNVFISITLQDTETFNRFKTVLPFYKNVLKDGISIIK